MDQLENSFSDPASTYKEVNTGGAEAKATTFRELSESENERELHWLKTDLRRAAVDQAFKHSANSFTDVDAILINSEKIYQFLSKDL